MTNRLNRRLLERFRGLVKWGKYLLLLLIVIALGDRAIRAWLDLRTKGTAWRLRSDWFLAGSMAYLLGMLTPASFFWMIMKRSDTPLNLTAVACAQVVSQVGKYVPGKALSVALRVGLLASHGAHPATTIIVTFYETLVVMAAGGGVAAACIVFVGVNRHPYPLLLSLGLTALFLTLALPPVFQGISKLCLRPFPGVGHGVLPRISMLLFAEGMLIGFFTWLFLGASCIFVMRSIHVPIVSAPDVSVVIASMALANVAGFALAIAPGGLGVREWVLTVTLVPVIGADAAILTALLLRLNWIVTEGLGACLFYGLYCLDRTRKKPRLSTHLAEADSFSERSNAS